MIVEASYITLTETFNHTTRHKHNISQQMLWPPALASGECPWLNKTTAIRLTVRCLFLKSQHSMTQYLKNIFKNCFTQILDLFWQGKKRFSEIR